MEEQKKKRKTRSKAVTEDTPLTPFEMTFIYEYLTGQRAEDIFKTLGMKYKSPNCARMAKTRMMRMPNVQKKIREILAEMEKNTVMTGQEVMEYFSAVTRGEIKDQFGLDAPLSERTKAAQEIAKRTIDLDIKREGLEDKNITVTLNWE